MVEKPKDKAAGFIHRGVIFPECIAPRWIKLGAVQKCLEVNPAWTHNKYTAMEEEPMDKAVRKCPEVDQP